MAGNVQGKWADAIKGLKRTRVESEKDVVDGNANERLPARKRRNTLPFHTAHFWDKRGLMDAFMEKDRSSSPDPPSSPFTLSDVLPPPPPPPPSFTLHTPASFDRRSDTSSSNTPSSARSTRIPHVHDTPAFSPSHRPMSSDSKDFTCFSYARQTSPRTPSIASAVAEGSPSRKKTQEMQASPAITSAQKVTMTRVQKTASDPSDPSVATCSVRVKCSPPLGNPTISVTDLVDMEILPANQNGNSTTLHTKRTGKAKKKTKAKSMNADGEVSQGKRSAPALIAAPTDSNEDERTGRTKRTSPDPTRDETINSKFNFLCGDPGPRIEMRQVLSSDLQARYEMLHTRMKMEAEASWESFEFERGTDPK